ncbi:MAG: nucleotidyltransferase family protein [Anaerotruncus sp.]|nr:nucleotidyltransferase family protein [Anaerotruncus sp.]
MGTQKLLLPFGDATVVEAVVRTALASGVDRAVAVLGADRDAVRAKLEPSGVDFAVNERFADGMLSSIQTGFPGPAAGGRGRRRSCSATSPSCRRSVVDAVVRGYRESRKGIVIPVFRARRGHPVLVDLKYRDEVLALDPADGLRRLMRAHPEDIAEVEVDDANILRDLDTPEDYSEVKKGVKPKLFNMSAYKKDQVFTNGDLVFAFRQRAAACEDLVLFVCEDQVLAWI